MSADAKAWCDNDGWSWRGIHDGVCQHGESGHQQDTLAELLADIQACVGQRLRWEIRRYQGDEDGLVGYIA